MNVKMRIIKLKAPGFDINLELFCGGKGRKIELFWGGFGTNTTLISLI